MALMDDDEATGVCKRDAVGRVRVPAARREALLDEFERSSLSGAQFARAAGIHYQTFACWVQRRRHDRGDYERRPKVRSAALRLVEAVVAAPQASAAQAPCLEHAVLEVLLPGGGKVLISHASQVPLVSQLLRALQSPC
jgi:hypothetical protein